MNASEIKSEVDVGLVERVFEAHDIYMHQINGLGVRCDFDSEWASRVFLGRPLSAYLGDTGRHVVTNETYSSRAKRDMSTLLRVMEELKEEEGMSKDIEAIREFNLHLNEIIDFIDANNQNVRNDPSCLEEKYNSVYHVFNPNDQRPSRFPYQTRWVFAAYLHKAMNEVLAAIEQNGEPTGKYVEIYTFLTSGERRNKFLVPRLIAAVKAKYDASHPSGK
jgi:hypothetical protein